MLAKIEISAECRSAAFSLKMRCSCSLKNRNASSLSLGTSCSFRMPSIREKIILCEALTFSCWHVSSGLKFCTLHNNTESVFVDSFDTLARCQFCSFPVCSNREVARHCYRIPKLWCCFGGFNVREYGALLWKVIQNGSVLTLHTFVTNFLKSATLNFSSSCRVGSERAKKKIPGLKTLLDGEA